jgi:hypothetical protein
MGDRDRPERARDRAGVSIGGEVTRNPQTGAAHAVLDSIWRVALRVRAR